MDSTEERLNELVRRVFSHVGDAKKELEKRGDHEHEDKIFFTQWTLTNLQAQINRAAAVLCLEEIVFISAQVLRGVPKPEIKPDSPPKRTEEFFVTSARILAAGLGERSRMDSQQPKGSALEDMAQHPAFMPGGAVELPYTMTIKESEGGAIETSQRVEISTRWERVCNCKGSGCYVNYNEAGDKVVLCIKCATPWEKVKAE